MDTNAEGYQCESVSDESLFEGFNPAGAIPAHGPWVCIEVTDTGRGMDSNTLERLFHPFFTTKLTGRGLGMAVILGIGEACEGAIFVNSVPGNGNTVRVFFSALTSDARSRTTEASGSHAPDSPGRKVREALGTGKSKVESNRQREDVRNAGG